MKKIIFLLITVTILGCGTTQNLQDKLISEHPEWTSEEVSLIKENKIIIGMTKDMVLASWGEPNYINQNNSTYSGDVISWTYYSIFGSDIKVASFQNDKVTMFNVSRPNL